MTLFIQSDSKRVCAWTFLWLFIECHGAIKVCVLFSSTLNKLLGSCNKQEKEIDDNFLVRKSYLACLNLQSIKINDFLWLNVTFQFDNANGLKEIDASA